MTCRHCELIEEMSSLNVEESIKEQLSLEKDIVSSDVRDSRLIICGQCENLVGHTCQICGCYVKFRASLSYKSCPILKWQENK